MQGIGEGTIAIVGFAGVFLFATGIADSSGGASLWGLALIGLSIASIALFIPNP
jgi:hypothetical protein